MEIMNGRSEDVENIAQAFKDRLRQLCINYGLPPNCSLDDVLLYLVEQGYDTAEWLNDAFYYRICEKDI